MLTCPSLFTRVHNAADHTCMHTCRYYMIVLENTPPELLVETDEVG